MSVVVTPVALPSATTKALNPLATSADSTFEESYYRRLAYNSGAGVSSAIKVAKKARLVSCIGTKGLTIWKIPIKSSLDGDKHMLEELPLTEAGWERVLEMELNVATNLVSSAISDDGRWLAVSDLSESKLFTLTTSASPLLLSPASSVNSK
jgi:U3 small nucleolar RNA-associated protein 4